MKKSIYRAIAWITLILGALFIIMPFTPGMPILILSAYLFTKTKPEPGHT